ncbi:hypothetical protein EV361DRAFT_873869 [Lentinula raphanica]|nr:hypothetical protein EV361DRAFT_873869 [Lentinula raphanica]
MTYIDSLPVPRKCVGFGLSDGEGLNHAASENLAGIGKWLARKWHNAEQRYLEANVEVKGAGHEPFKFSGQSKEAGRKAVDNALRLKKANEMLVEQIAKLEDILSDLHAEDYEIVEAETQLPVLRKKLSEGRSALVREERKLGIEDKATYRHLGESPFINLQMNARAIKIRLRNHRVHHHTEDSVKKRDPSIQKLARQYNSLCAEMQRLISLNCAPRNACSPVLIPMKDLFNLDVDDEIWQDVGLDDVDGQDPPL